ncbi:helix-turn-helix transcriptional regulator [Corynebacterium neomassiliense]|uniref:helix-turn-helix transcriptional regulator n=1 Tax=Corynebacterium neomassiliense TaxID=2079482 RepID=UPI00103095AB|nr:WYL domain-containing protein [Corynebacterium neomassiliense]
MTTTGDAASPAAPSRRGSAVSRLDQLRRILSVLAWFRTHPDATLMTTAERFGVSVPQLREELRQVRYSGLPGLLPGDTVDLDIDGAGVTLRDLQGLGRPLALNDTEAATLVLNLEKLSSILTDGERADADSAASVVRSLVPPRHRGGPLPVPTPAAPAETGPGSSAADTLAVLREANSSRRWVRFSYLSVSSDSRTVREIIPDTVAVLDGSGYLWGRPAAGEDTGPQRCFSVSRMDDVEILDRAAPPAQPRQITAEDPFGFLDAADSWAELTLTGEAMWMLEYLPVWHIDGTRVEIPDTGQWLDRFLIAYAPEITAVEPADVAERAVNRCESALAAYGRLA